MAKLFQTYDLDEDGFITRKEWIGTDTVFSTEPLWEAVVDWARHQDIAEVKVKTTSGKVLQEQSGKVLQEKIFTPSRLNFIVVFQSGDKTIWMDFY